MPITIEQDQLPAGLALTNGHEGDSIPVQSAGYLSSDDGCRFTDFAESFVGSFPNLVGPQGRVSHSQVETFLAIFRRSRSVTAYCNELAVVATIRPNRAVAQGEAISRSDILDICGAEFRTENDELIDIRPDGGFFAVMSANWRKCLYFDFNPLVDHARLRQEPIGEVLAGILRRLHFGRIFQADEATWVRLCNWGFFPFVVLSERQRDRLFSYTQRNDDPTRLLEELCVDLRAQVLVRSRTAAARNFFSEDRPFFERAIERYEADDYVSCISILYPRIEGVLRRMMRRRNSNQRVTQERLCDSVLDGMAIESLLLPTRFRQYLAQFFFQNFDETASQIPLSRHSVSHGVHRLEDCDLLRATIGLLILVQIGYYVPQ